MGVTPVEDQMLVAMKLEMNQPEFALLRLAVRSLVYHYEAELTG